MLFVDVTLCNLNDIGGSHWFVCGNTGYFGEFTCEVGDEVLLVIDVSDFAVHTNATIVKHVAFVYTAASSASLTSSVLMFRYFIVVVTLLCLMHLHSFSSDTPAFISVFA